VTITSSARSSNQPWSPLLVGTGRNKPSDEPPSAGHTTDSAGGSQFCDDLSRIAQLADPDLALRPALLWDRHALVHVGHG
jgi:hypothetical protein